MDTSPPQSPQPSGETFLARRAFRVASAATSQDGRSKSPLRRLLVETQGGQLYFVPLGTFGAYLAPGDEELEGLVKWRDIFAALPWWGRCLLAAVPTIGALVAAVYVYALLSAGEGAHGRRRGSVLGIAVLAALAEQVMSYVALSVMSRRASRLELSGRQALLAHSQLGAKNFTTRVLFRSAEIGFLVIVGLELIAACSASFSLYQLLALVLWAACVAGLVTLLIASMGLWWELWRSPRPRWLPSAALLRLIFALRLLMPPVFFVFFTVRR